MERILVINPGSTSTKLAVFDGETELFRTSIEHDQKDTAKFLRAIDQLDFRKECVLNTLKERNIPVESLNCIVSRGGMFPPCKVGAYEVNADMLSYVNSDHIVGEHISNVGCAVAEAIARPLGIPAMVYDCVSVDEMTDIAHISGIPELPRESRGHALNTRAMARKCAEEILHKPFEECTFIVQHLGGGVDLQGAIGDDAGIVPALALVIVHDEHMVGHVLAKDQSGGVRLFLQFGGAGDFDLFHGEFPPDYPMFRRSSA